MKKSISLSLLALIFLLPLIAFTQSNYYSANCSSTFTSCSSPSSPTWNSNYKRGVYVNYFFNFDPYDGDWDPTPPNYGVKTSYTVLCQGTYNSSTDLYSIEEDLLNYLFANNFTSICIYGVERMLRNPTHSYGVNRHTMVCYRIYDTK